MSGDGIYIGVNTNLPTCWKREMGCRNIAQRCRHSVQGGESREIYNILIPAELSGSFKYTWGVDQKQQVLISDLSFLAQSNCHISIFGSHSSISMPAQVFICCDLSISSVLLKLFCLKSEIFNGSYNSCYNEITSSDILPERGFDFKRVAW